jgi:ribosome-associated protein
VIRVTHAISIDERLLHFSFIRSSGPGGQNVNKVATAVQLRFDAAAAGLNDEVYRRLLSLAGRRATEAGQILIDSRRHRTQNANRADALARLLDLLRRAAIAPRRRIPTKPTLASRRRRLETKQRRSRLKSSRRGPVDDP